MSTASRSRLRGRSSGTNTVTGTRTWPRRPGTSGLAALVALLACGSAAASDDVEERIARCAAATSSGERIACLERNLRELAGAPSAAAEPVAGAGEPVSSPPSKGSRPAAATPGVPVPNPAEAPATAEEEPPVSARETPPLIVDPAPAPATPPDPESGVELGAEQVKARTGTGDEETPRVRARVVDYRFVGYQRLMVQLDNGQVWRQIDGDRESVERGLRDVDTFEVEMWATKLGGYRMRILPLGRIIRVERLR